jgi:hypothetical protein
MPEDPVPGPDEMIWQAYSVASGPVEREYVEL